MGTGVSGSEVPDEDAPQLSARGMGTLWTSSPNMVQLLTPDNKMRLLDHSVRAGQPNHIATAASLKVSG